MFYFVVKDEARRMSGEVNPVGRGYRRLSEGALSLPRYFLL